MICVICGRDINAIGQDNVSYIPGKPMCENCMNARIKEDEEDFLTYEHNRYFK